MKKKNPVSETIMKAKQMTLMLSSLFQNLIAPRCILAGTPEQYLKPINSRRTKILMLFALMLLGGNLSLRAQTETTVTESSNLVNIPDNNASGANAQVSFSGIPADAILSNIEVSLGINHQNVGDLIIKLIAPTGDEITLVDRPERNTFGDFEDANLVSTHPISFSDAYLSNPELMGTVPALDTNGEICKDDGNCTFLPNDDTANRKTFADLMAEVNANGGPNGSWRINISDRAGNNMGNFRISNLRLTYFQFEPCTPANKLSQLEGTTAHNVHLDDNISRLGNSFVPNCNGQIESLRVFTGNLTEIGTDVLFEIEVQVHLYKDPFGSPILLESSEVITIARGSTGETLDIIFNMPHEMIGGQAYAFQIENLNSDQYRLEMLFAINSNPYPAGEVVIGESFASNATLADWDMKFEVTYVDPSCLIDTDNDGVVDCNDQEINSPCPDDVNAQGVSKDQDGDGVFNCLDQEINSPCPDDVDANGVSNDDDGDGIPNCNDLCNGAADLDNDGVCNEDDQCSGIDDKLLDTIDPGTITFADGSTALTACFGEGTTFSIIEASTPTLPEQARVIIYDEQNGNWIYTSADYLGSTISVDASFFTLGTYTFYWITLGDDVDTNSQGELVGCYFLSEAITLTIVGDTDNDGVCDGIDQEINSPCPSDVDANGVSNDDDGDGVPNCNDVCDGAADTDNDGVCNEDDQCPGIDDKILETIDAGTITFGDGSTALTACLGEGTTFSVIEASTPTLPDQTRVIIYNEQNGSWIYTSGAYLGSEVSVDASFFNPGTYTFYNLTNSDNTDENNAGELTGCYFLSETSITLTIYADTDNDGICNDLDQEINSPCPEDIDANGVSIDDDGDGVANCDDVCVGGDDKVDTDTDGVPNDCDTCEGLDDNLSLDAGAISFADGSTTLFGCLAAPPTFSIIETSSPTINNGVNNFIYMQVPSGEDKILNANLFGVELELDLPTAIGIYTIWYVTAGSDFEVDATGAFSGCYILSDPISIVISEECYTEQDAFVTKWRVVENENNIPDRSIEIPTIGDGYSFYIDWGDSSPLEYHDDGNTWPRHVYAAEGDYVVKIYGTFPRIATVWATASYADRLLEVMQWGNIQWDTMKDAFRNCSYLDITATDTPDLSNVTSTQFMFHFCGNLIGNSSFNDWDVSNVSNFGGMFFFCRQFNQPLNNWNVGNATNMQVMFHDCTDFNQPLDNWDVSKVTNMGGMFIAAASMSYSIGMWDISSLEDASLMFASTNISTEMYDDILIGWATLDAAAGEVRIPSDIEISFLRAKYCIAHAEHDLLDNVYNWTFTDGGILNSDCLDTCPDFDNDGICDADDQEVNSPCPDDVDANGVSNDDDGDGTPNCSDDCDDTIDADNDGVADCVDQELGSPCPDDVDANGVSKDDDGDGTPNCTDDCDDTIDADNDGVADCIDQELGSPCPDDVDANGVSNDKDGDGTPNCTDDCDDTIDADNDGVADCVDQELNSPCPDDVDANGVSNDVDGDGIANCEDSCNDAIDPGAITWADGSTNLITCPAQVTIIESTVPDLPANTALLYQQGDNGAYIMVSSDYIGGPLNSDDVLGTATSVTFWYITMGDDFSMNDTELFGCYQLSEPITLISDTDSDGDGLCDNEDAEPNSPCPDDVDINGISNDEDQDGTANCEDACPGIDDALLPLHPGAITFNDGSTNLTTCQGAGLTFSVIESEAPTLPEAATVVFINPDAGIFGNLTLGEELQSNTTLAGTYTIWYVTAGDNFNINGNGEFEGCYYLSNPITLTVEEQCNQTPVAVCQDITVYTGDDCQASISAAQLDGGSSDPDGDELTFSINDEGPFAVGDQVLTLMVDDGELSSTCTATVSVEDNTAPTATCQDVTIQLDDNGLAAITVSDINNGSNDACGLANISLDQNSFNCEDVGDNTVTLTVTDLNGNSEACDATVIVEDNTIPVANCQDLTIQLDEDGLASITTVAIDNGSNDACGIANLSLDKASFDCTNLGDNTVTLTATDNHSNSSSCTATVSIIDEIAPTLTCPQDLNVNTNQGECGAYVSLPKAAPADNCGIQSLQSRYRNIDEAGNPVGSWSAWDGDHSEFFELGAYEIQWRAQDASDNEVFCSFQLNIIDEEAPEVICKDITINFNGEESIAISSVSIFDEVASFDACGAVSFVSQSLTEASCADVGETLTIQVVGIDPNGNTSTCDAQVTVIGMPCAFEATDIDCPNGAGATYDPVTESYTLTANDCEGYPDGEFSTVMTELCGDGEIIAKVASLSGDGRAGVTMMESADPGARFVSKIKDLTPRTRTEYRMTTGGNISNKSKNRTGVKWVKIVREGPKFKTYTSTNGSYWRKSHTIEYETFADCIQVGMLVYSKNANEPVTAVFDNVKVIGDSPSALEQITTDAASALQGVAPQQTQTDRGTGIDLKVAPNPFADQTQIEFTLPKASDVTLEIYNLHGQRIKSLESARLDAGTHRYEWDGQGSKGISLPTGIYMLRLRADKKWFTTKVSLINR